VDGRSHYAGESGRYCRVRVESIIGPIADGCGVQGYLIGQYFDKCGEKEGSTLLTWNLKSGRNTK